MKKLIIYFQEYKSSEIEEIACLINKIRPYKLAILRFGEFQSIKSFVLEVLGYLKYIKALKINISNTFLAGQYV